MEDKKPTTIDKYIGQFTPDIQTVLYQLRETIKKAAPAATEKISWGMATFYYHGNLVHFAANKNHVGFYPSSSTIETFKEELVDYKYSKGTVQFPYNKPLPYDLITRMVGFRVAEQESLNMSKKDTTKNTTSISKDVIESESIERTNTSKTKKITTKKKDEKEDTTIWTVSMVLEELEKLGTAQTKKTYMRHGAREPLFGVPTGAMKPLAKKIKKNYQLAMDLYATGNYDAAYFAGIIADTEKMTRDDFELWMKSAYFHMMSDYIVAVSLAETDFAMELSDKWIATNQDLYMSAGWSCYCWLLGNRPDEYFDKEKLHAMLQKVATSIHSMPNRTRYSMNNFVMTVGISYLPLHQEALVVAREIGDVEVDLGKTSCKTPSAYDYIEKAATKGKVGFKRKYLRC